MRDYHAWRKQNVYISDNKIAEIMDMLVDCQGKSTPFHRRRCFPRNWWKWYGRSLQCRGSPLFNKSCWNLVETSPLVTRLPPQSRSVFCSP